MLIGALLIAAGLALAYFSREFGRAERLAFIVGALIALLGVALFAIDLFDVDNADAAVRTVVHMARSSWSIPLARLGLS